MRAFSAGLVGLIEAADINDVVDSQQDTVECVPHQMKNNRGVTHIDEQILCEYLGIY